MIPILYAPISRPFQRLVFLIARRNEVQLSKTLRTSFMSTQNALPIRRSLSRVGLFSCIVDPSVKGYYEALSLGIFSLKLKIHSSIPCQFWNMRNRFLKKDIVKLKEIRSEDFRTKISRTEKKAEIKEKITNYLLRVPPCLRTRGNSGPKGKAYGTVGGLRPKAMKARRKRREINSSHVLMNFSKLARKNIKKQNEDSKDLKPILKKINMVKKSQNLKLPTSVEIGYSGPEVCDAYKSSRMLKWKEEALKVIHAHSEKRNPRKLVKRKEAVAFKRKKKFTPPSMNRNMMMKTPPSVSHFNLKTGEVKEVKELNRLKKIVNKTTVSRPVMQTTFNNSRFGKGINKSHGFQEGRKKLKVSEEFRPIKKVPQKSRPNLDDRSCVIEIGTSTVEPSLFDPRSKDISTPSLSEPKFFIDTLEEENCFRKIKSTSSDLRSLDTPTLERVEVSVILDPAYISNERNNFVSLENKVSNPIIKKITPSAKPVTKKKSGIISRIPMKRQDNLVRENDVSREAEKMSVVCKNRVKNILKSENKPERFQTSSSTIQLKNDGKRQQKDFKGKGTVRDSTALERVALTKLEAYLSKTNSPEKPSPSTNEKLTSLTNSLQIKSYPTIHNEQTNMVVKAMEEFKQLSKPSQRSFGPKFPNNSNKTSEKSSEMLTSKKNQEKLTLSKSDTISINSKPLISLNSPNNVCNSSENTKPTLENEVKSPKTTNNFFVYNNDNRLTNIAKEKKTIPTVSLGQKNLEQSKENCDKSQSLETKSSDSIVKRKEEVSTTKVETTIPKSETKLSNLNEDEHKKDLDTTITVDSTKINILFGQEQYEIANGRNKNENNTPHQGKSLTAKSESLSGLQVPCFECSETPSTGSVQASAGLQKKNDNKASDVLNEGSTENSSIVVTTKKTFGDSIETCKQKSKDKLEKSKTRILQKNDQITDESRTITTTGVVKPVDPQQDDKNSEKIQQSFKTCGSKINLSRLSDNRFKQIPSTLRSKLKSQMDSRRNIQAAKRLKENIIKELQKDSIPLKSGKDRVEEISSKNSKHTRIGRAKAFMNKNTIPRKENNILGTNNTELVEKKIHKFFLKHTNKKQKTSGGSQTILRKDKEKLLSSHQGSIVSFRKRSTILFLKNTIGSTRGTVHFFPAISKRPRKEINFKNRFRYSTKKSDNDPPSKRWLPTVCPHKDIPKEKEEKKPLSPFRRSPQCPAMCPPVKKKTKIIPKIKPSSSKKKQKGYSTSGIPACSPLPIEPNIPKRKSARNEETKKRSCSSSPRPAKKPTCQPLCPPKKPTCTPSRTSLKCPPPPCPIRKPKCPTKKPPCPPPCPPKKPCPSPSPPKKPTCSAPCPPKKPTCPPPCPTKKEPPCPPCPSKKPSNLKTKGLHSPTYFKGDLPITSIRMNKLDIPDTRSLLDKTEQHSVVSKSLTENGFPTLVSVENTFSDPNCSSSKESAPSNNKPRYHLQSQHARPECQRKRSHSDDFRPIGTRNYPSPFLAGLPSISEYVSFDSVSPAIYPDNICDCPQSYVAPSLPPKDINYYTEKEIASFKDSGNLNTVSIPTNRGHNTSKNNLKCNSNDSKECDYNISKANFLLGASVSSPPAEVMCNPNVDRKLLSFRDSLVVENPEFKSKLNEEISPSNSKNYSDCSSTVMGMRPPRDPHVSKKTLNNIIEQQTRNNSSNIISVLGNNEISLIKSIDNDGNEKYVPEGSGEKFTELDKNVSEKSDKNVSEKSKLSYIYDSRFSSYHMSKAYKKDSSDFEDNNIVKQDIKSHNNELKPSINLKFKSNNPISNELKPSINLKFKSNNPISNELKPPISLKSKSNKPISNELKPPIDLKSKSNKPISDEVKLKIDFFREKSKDLMLKMRQGDEKLASSYKELLKYVEKEKIKRPKGKYSQKTPKKNLIQERTTVSDTSDLPVKRQKSKQTLNKITEKFGKRTLNSIYFNKPLDYLKNRDQVPDSEVDLHDENVYRNMVNVFVQKEGKEISKKDSVFVSSSSVTDEPEIVSELNEISAALKENKDILLSDKTYNPEKSSSKFEEMEKKNADLETNQLPYTYPPSSMVQSSVDSKMMSKFESILKSRPSLRVSLKPSFKHELVTNPNLTKELKIKDILSRGQGTLKYKETPSLTKINVKRYKPKHNFNSVKKPVDPSLSSTPTSLVVDVVKSKATKINLIRPETTKTKTDLKYERNQTDKDYKSLSSSESPSKEDDSDIKILGSTESPSTEDYSDSKMLSALKLPSKEVDSDCKNLLNSESLPVETDSSQVEIEIELLPDMRKKIQNEQRKIVSKTPIECKKAGALTSSTSLDSSSPPCTTEPVSAEIVRDSETPKIESKKTSGDDVLIEKIITLIKKNDKFKSTLTTLLSGKTESSNQEINEKSIKRNYIRKSLKKSSDSYGIKGSYEQQKQLKFTLQKYKKEVSKTNRLNNLSVKPRKIPVNLSFGELRNNAQENINKLQTPCPLGLRMLEANALNKLKTLNFISENRSEKNQNDRSFNRRVPFPKKREFRSFFPSSPSSDREQGNEVQATKDQPNKKINDSSYEHTSTPKSQIATPELINSPSEKAPAPTSHTSSQKTSSVHASSPTGSHFTVGTSSVSSSSSNKLNSLFAISSNQRTPVSSRIKPEQNKSQPVNLSNTKKLNTSSMVTSSAPTSTSETPLNENIPPLSTHRSGSLSSTPKRSGRVSSNLTKNAQKKLSPLYLSTNQLPSLKSDGNSHNPYGSSMLRSQNSSLSRAGTNQEQVPSFAFLRKKISREHLSQMKRSLNAEGSDEAQLHDPENTTSNLPQVSQMSSTPSNSFFDSQNNHTPNSFTTSSFMPTECMSVETFTHLPLSKSETSVHSSDDSKMAISLQKVPLKDSSLPPLSGKHNSHNNLTDGEPPPTPHLMTTSLRSRKSDRLTAEKTLPITSMTSAKKRITVSGLDAEGTQSVGPDDPHNYEKREGRFPKSLKRGYSLEEIRGEYSFRQKEDSCNDTHQNEVASLQKKIRIKEFSGLKRKFRQRQVKTENIGYSYSEYLEKVLSKKS